MPSVFYTDGPDNDFTTGLIFGLAGAGKTPIGATLPKPLIISTEPGLKSLKFAHIPYVIARNRKELAECHSWLKGGAAKQFDSLYLDSISALSEGILAEEKRKVNDPRKFSPATTAATIEIVMDWLQLGQTLGKHMWMTCKAVEILDQLTGSRFVEPFAVVPKLGPMLPYHFDNVFYLERWIDSNDGRVYPRFVCQVDMFARQTRNRIGLLNHYELANLTDVINKSLGKNRI